jgi:hypothetical protein
MKHLTLLTTIRSETVSGNVNAPNQDIGQAWLIFFSCFQKQYHFQKDHQKYEHQFPNIYLILQYSDIFSKDIILF